MCSYYSKWVMPQKLCADQDGKQKINFEPVAIPVLTIDIAI